MNIYETACYIIINNHYHLSTFTWSTNIWASIMVTLPTLWVISFEPMVKVSFPFNLWCYVTRVEIWGNPKGLVSSRIWGNVWAASWSLSMKSASVSCVFSLVGLYPGLRQLTHSTSQQRFNRHSPSLILSRPRSMVLSLNVLLHPLLLRNYHSSHPSAASLQSCRSALQLSF